jgi:cyanophycinase
LADLLDQFHQILRAIDAAETFQCGMIGLGNELFDLGNIAQVSQAIDEFVEQSLGDRSVDRFQPKSDIVQNLLGLRRVQTMLRCGQSILADDMLCCGASKRHSRGQDIDASRDCQERSISFAHELASPAGVEIPIKREVCTKMMKPSFCRLFVCSLLLCSTTIFAKDPTPARTTSTTTGSTAATATTIGPSKGTLIIVGGGGMTPDIWKRFIDLAGGADAKIIVIPTADEDANIGNDRTVEKIRSLGVKQVTVLHTRDPKVADTEKFVEPLQTATGVWFGGGRQWRLADAYLNTRTQKELFALLDRGGVIAGSSAGATIQGSYLVRGDTSGPEIVEGDHTVGLGFLKKSAIDQHILRRNREFDLIPLIESHPDLLGIGIDETTAIVVHGNQLEVIGVSYVAITDHRQWTSPGHTSPNDAAQKGKIYLLGRGDRFDLTTRRIVRGAKADANAK